MSSTEPPSPPGAEEPSDLGFGSFVARDSRLRLLNHDGSFNVRRRGLRFWESLGLYHWLINLTWPRFLAVVCGSFLLVNILFALGYLACGTGALLDTGPAPAQSSFARAFYFSVETFSTIGYGNIVPQGTAPNLVVVAEALVGLLWLALATGLLFARFSRPTAKILFSRHAIIAPYHGITAFEFRLVNAHRSQIIELQAKVLFSFLKGKDGHRSRHFEDLDLERHSVVFFPLTWTVVHPINDSSPLHGWTEKELRAADAEFLILLTGFDETFAQTVHARSSYKPGEIIWNARFVNLYAHIEGKEPIAIDLSRFHEVERVV